MGRATGCHKGAFYDLPCVGGDQKLVFSEDEPQLRHVFNYLVFSLDDEGAFSINGLKRHKVVSGDKIIVKNVSGQIRVEHRNEPWVC